MKIIKVMAASASLLVLAAMPAPAQTAAAALKSVDGKDVGAVELTQTPTGVLLKVSVKGLPPGEHAHVHAVGNAILPLIPQVAISTQLARNMASWRLRDTMPATCRTFTFHERRLVVSAGSCDHAGAGQAQFGIRSQRHSYRDPCRCRRLQDRSGRQCRRTYRLRRDHVALLRSRRSSDGGKHDLLQRREVIFGLAGLTIGQTLVGRARLAVAADKIKPGASSALIVVDVQNCFLPGGSLAVKEGDQVIPVINRIAKGFDNVVMTQDWHTPHHMSFASSYPDKKPFDAVKVAYGDQVLWDHCVGHRRRTNRKDVRFLRPT